MEASDPAHGASTAAPPGPSVGDAPLTLARHAAEDAVTARGPERFSNRELSWLEFSSRLLDLAQDRTVPLLERVKFLAIFSEGLTSSSRFVSPASRIGLTQDFAGTPPTGCARATRCGR